MSPPIKKTLTTTISLKQTTYVYKPIPYSMCIKQFDYMHIDFYTKLDEAQEFKIYKDPRII